MSWEFVLPLHLKDLQQGTGINQYIVEEVYPVRQVGDKVVGSKSALHQDGSFMILDHFDSFYSLLRQFQSVEQDVREEAWEIILSACAKNTEAVGKFIAESVSDHQNRHLLLNSTKMTTFILCQLTEAFETEACKPSTDTAALKGRGRAKKSVKAGEWDWDSEKERSLQCLIQTLQLDIARLWDPPVVEEEFVNLVSGCCYKLLENPSITRNHSAREVITQVLGLLFKRYNHVLGGSLKMLQLLQHFEHLPSPLAQAVHTIATQCGVKSVVSEIMRELGSMDPNDLARDNSGTRSYAAYLVEMAQKVPDLMLPCISLILCHLDGESYTMRNGILGVIGEIVVRVLTKEQLDKKAKTDRDQLLDKLEDHIHDVNAFSRSRCLQVWLHLCNERAIPLTRQHSVMELAVGRLKDKSSMVRKAAVQLISTFLTSNPFAAKLSAEELQLTLEKEQEKLKEMMPEQKDSTGTDVSGKPEHNWAAMEPEIKASIEKALAADEENPVQIPEDTAPVDVIDEIIELLDKSHHTRAIGLLQAARDCFPDHQAFTVLTADTDPTDEEENEDEALSSKGKILFDLLKTIYLGSTPADPVPSDYNPAELVKLDEAGEPEILVLESQGEEDPVVNEVSKQQILVQYLSDCVNFAGMVKTCVPTVCELLSSKQTTDILEAVGFFVTAQEFGVSNAGEGVRRMLALIWSKEQSIKDAVVGAYKRLYLDPAGKTVRARSLAVVRNLIQLTYGASLGELTSLEEMVAEFSRSGEFPSQTVQILWEFFTMKHPETTPTESRAALQLLGMAAGADSDIIRSNVEVLVSEGLGERGEKNFLLAKDTCLALLKLVGNKKPKVLSGKEQFRFPSTHKIFTRLDDILVKGMNELENGYWVPLAETAVLTIYRLAEHPDIICGEILKRLAAVLLASREQPEGSPDAGSEEGEQPSSGCPSGLLCRLMAISGQVALQQLIHLDVMVQCELKRRRNIQEGKKEAAKKEKAKSEGDNTNIEDEMGLAGASAEDAEGEFIKRICDSSIVTGPNLMGALKPLIVLICSDPSKYSSPELRAAASLALAKFMLVSAEFCEAHLQLLFTVLEKAPEPIIRANTIIAIGDLTFRFPNLVEPWTPNMYARLRDPSAHVRKNTLMVLTHLILNDMVKVKGQISEMATCIVDQEPRIASLAKLFFFELSRKGNAVYNILPDVISRLSDPELNLPEDQFKTILKYLLAFIQKDKQAESLVEKLCHRFRATRSECQVRELAFCLSLLNFNDKGFRKLQENVACYADKVADPEVYGYFTTIISKAKKTVKQETKVLVEDYEQKMAEFHTKGVDENATVEKATKASSAAAALSKNTRTPGRKKRGKKGQTPARALREKDLNRDSENDEDDNLDDDDDRAGRHKSSLTASLPDPGSAPRISRKGRKKVPLPIPFSSDEDSDDVFAPPPKPKVKLEAESDDENNENVNPGRSTSKRSTKPSAKTPGRRRKQQQQQPSELET
ncbi:condensin complex subunit 1-like [Diadema antillarum]|uniref:condensin complex subunit 1-like n=1 Tax=Diadema antillarum TaxID=105358 RepID=UPI003A8AA424